MAKRNSNLAEMSVDALLKLRDDIGAVLSRKAVDLKHQLARLAGMASAGNGATRGRKAHPRKGLKVAPKFRDPKTGATWAGRGARPRWLQAYIKEGRSPDDFAIAAKAGRPAKKVAARKARKAKSAAA